MTYGRRVLSTKEVPDAYAYRYKGIWVCLSILTRALSGNYVNFGVFDLYGDPALKVTLGNSQALRRWILQNSKCVN